MIDRDLCIPTGSKENIQRICTCVANQTVFPTRIIILIHLNDADEILDIKKVARDSLGSLLSRIELVFISKGEFGYAPGGGVGADRDTLLHSVQSSYLYTIDDDNVFDANFFERSIASYQYLQSMYADDIVWSPLIERRTSGKVQSGGIVGVNWFFPKRFFRRGQPSISQNLSSHEVIAVGANSLFGSSKHMKEIGFDKEFSSCMEDIDFIRRLRRSGVRVFVSDGLSIQHMERDKSYLDHKFIGSAKSAFSRAEKRIYFGIKNLTLFQKTQYFFFGYWIQTCWLLTVIVCSGSKKKRLLSKSLIAGTFSGLKKYLFNSCGK